MIANFRPLAALLLGTAVLVLGQGLLLALVPLQMNAMDFSVQSVGLVGAAYFAGFLTGAWDGSRMIRLVGHIRAYGGLIALVIVVVLSLPLFPDAFAWVLLRFVHGLAAGGVFLAIEAWLNAASEDRLRGRVLAAYTVVTLAALGASQFMPGVIGVEGTVPFVVGGILYAFSIIPVMLSKTSAPALPEGERKSLKELYLFSPFGVVTSLATGLCVGAFWALGPYFAARAGLDIGQVSTLMAATVFSGLVLQWPAGAVSDRIDRRRVVLILAAVGAVASLFCALAGSATLYVGFAALGSVFCLYPISVAHALDHVTRREDTLEVSRGLLMANGLGQTLGPLICGQFMFLLGTTGFLLFFLAVLGGIAAFSSWRVVRRPAAAAEQQEKFMAVRAATPAGTVLDPRVGEG